MEGKDPPVNAHLEPESDIEQADAEIQWLIRSRTYSRLIKFAWQKVDVAFNEIAQKKVLMVAA
jgi:hypothetical protein